MSENEQHHNNNTVIENSAAPIIKEISMQYRWFQKINNTAHYYQTPFNITLILEQMSNHNNLLREQMNMEKGSYMDETK